MNEEKWPTTPTFIFSTTYFFVADSLGHFFRQTAHLRFIQIMIFFLLEVIFVIDPYAMK